MIDEINKEIEKFLSSIVNNKKNISSIIKKSSTSISDDLKKGHITSNVCMVAASILKLNPKNLAEDLKTRLEKIDKFANVEVAGPGFVNISLNREDFVSTIEFINKNKDSFGSSAIGKKNKVQIEFVSANPTGPLHVGHGRGAAYGDAIGRILESTGSIVEKEYYVNDAGRQIDILTASVILRLIKNDISNYFPANGYKGEYIDEIGKKLDKKVKIQDFKSLSIKSSEDPEEEIDNIIHELEKLNNNSWNLIKKFSLKEIVKSIEDDLKAFNVNFDKWFYESSLGKIGDDSSDIALSVNKLIKDGHAYEKDKAIWLNTDISGDDKHRVLVRDNGKATYFASDVAYHKNKIDRGFDKLINVWGADHHGYIKRIEASIENLGSNKNKLAVKLVQFANLFKDGKKVKMSTRSGEFFTLKNLIEDIGSDAARFYYLSKQADQHLDFDLDLAKSDSKENIFYYIQYAHARIVSLEEKALDKFSEIKRNIKNISSGDYKECDNLIHEISKFPDIVNKSANTLQPHVIIYYLKDLSQLFHSFYNDNHVLSESEENMQSILECLIAVKQVISNGLNLLGITPMQKM
ncbi:MAG: arginine--tRNA ligase [SAR86 cluster bacterium SAR86A]|uniref:Arginine--tRNA ligase n=1 Tax=SAR86 cluster bacterium SAR86A TaxID=1123866 RepID=J4WP51_9GAMM|nr:MAG: arginine--tRNA ligase [SAR86 cluster bacterium SAR86A]MDC2972592.1 arginine--tRNA ligase [Gammaproteobacteria bacterium]